MESKLEIVGKSKDALDKINAFIKYCEETKERLIQILESNPETIKSETKTHLEGKSDTELQLLYKMGCEFLSEEIKKLQENSTEIKLDERKEIFNGAGKMINTIIWAEIVYNTRNIGKTIQDNIPLNLEEIKGKIKENIANIDRRIEKARAVEATIQFLYGKEGTFKEDLDKIITNVLSGEINDTVEEILEKHFSIETTKVEGTEISSEEPIEPTIPKPTKTFEVSDKPTGFFKTIIIWWKTLLEYDSDRGLSWKEAEKEVLKRGLK